MEKCTKHEAILKARDFTGVPDLPTTQPRSIVKIVKPEPTTQQRTEILTEAFKHFARGLSTKSVKVIKYLESRNLDYKKLSIGHDFGSLHTIKETTDEKKQLYLQAGLIKPDKFGRANSYYTRFNGCIVFPLLDKTGNITSLYGRHIDKHEHHYLEGNHKGLYPGYPKAVTRTLILTEAIIDAATLVQNQEPGASNQDFEILALYGTNGFTKDHKQAIAELKELEEIILFFDGDEAGREAMNRIAPELLLINEKIKISYVETPLCEDVNSLSIGHDSEIFTHLINNRKPFSFSTENHSIEKEKLTKPETINNNQPATTKYQLKASTDCLRYETDHLRITLWGGVEIHTVNRLRVTLHLQLKSNEYNSFRDTADLYSHSQSDRLIKQASEKLEISSSIVNEAITGLTRELESYRGQKREEKRQSEAVKEKQGKDIFTREQMQKAAEFMQGNNLTRHTHELFGNMGMVGQHDNATLLFFIFLTRFFKNPLHAIVMGSSGSGKTHLLHGVAAVVPRQHIYVTTSLSENTLYYTPEDFLKHKILLLEDLDGAYNALLPIRELMSNQIISRFSTKTNSRTGDSKQVHLHVEGPVCIAGATTHDRIFEDNANRCFLIQIEENPKHETEVMEYQGRIAAGQINFKQHEKNTQLLKVSQLLIEPMEVIIPFAQKLELPPHVFKKMRTMTHYLTLIKAVTLWNQKQRKRVTDQEGNTCLLATLEDVEWANYLCKDSLLRKSDELGGKTRNFFESLKELQSGLQQGNPLFHVKDVRKYFRLHPMQLKRFLDELEGRGFIKCKSRSNKTGNEYEIMAWDDYQVLKNGLNMLDKLVENLKKEYLKA
jgi:DNA primase